MNSVEREYHERIALLDSMEKRITQLEGRKKPHRDPNIDRLVDSLFAMWSWDTQGIQPADWRDHEDAGHYRRALKGWWGEKEEHETIVAAIEEVIVITCQEQGLEMTYQMVDWLRNTMGYEP